MIVVKRIIFLIVLLAVLLISGCSIPDPDQTAENYINFFKQQNYSKMYEMIDSKSRQAISQEDFIKKYKEVYNKLGVKDIKISLISNPENTGFEIKDNRSILPLTGNFITWKVGLIDVSFELNMVWQDNKWWVDWDPDDILPGMTDITDTINVIRKQPLRGHIFDRNGVALTEEKSVYTIGIFPGRADNIENSVSLLAEKLGLDKKSIMRVLQQDWVNPDHFIKLCYISKEEWQEKKDELLSIPGVNYARDFHYARLYSGLKSLASTIGYLGEINSNELAEMKEKGYVIRDMVGRTGLERAYEEKLHGKPGFIIQIIDNKGQEKKVVKFTRPDHGEDLYLTIDYRLQSIVEQTMEENKGCVIGLNPDNGELLAIASFPGFTATDINLAAYSRIRLTDIIKSKRIKDLMTDKDRPLFNRALQGKYIPGSTFKLITSLAALEYFPEYKPEEKIEIPEETWQAEAGWGNYHVRRVSRPEGPVNLKSAMKWSDNIYFAKLAYDMGSTPLFKIANKLGFERDIPFILNTSSSRLAINKPILNTITLADTGYGQGEVAMNPLHLALIYAGVATDGKIMIPQIVKKEEEGQIWISKIADNDNLKMLQDILKSNIKDKDALAHYIDILELKVAGKTGTAQIGNDQENGAFVCYLPADNPELLLLVLIENVERGSREAAEVSKEILKK